LAGQYYDAETGHHHNWHRYYDPRIGRYLTPDPIGVDGGINFFAYVGGNPTNKIDPKGMIGFGAGAYYGIGGEFSYSETTCCENENKYLVKLFTSCGELGIGFLGKKPVKLKGTVGKSSSFNSISSTTGCPRTRYYVKHETTFGYRSVNVQLDDSLRPSAGIDVGIYGIGTSWVFCSDTVLSKKLINNCCK
jgi:RHS repeat-associated protein